LPLPVVPADAFAFEPFDCATAPLSPGWSTRTDTFEFAGLLCDASASDDACDVVPLCGALSFDCVAGASFAFADGLLAAFVDGFGLPFSLTGSDDDEDDDAGASVDDVVGVSFDDDVVALGDVSLDVVLGGSAAHAAVPHASVAKIAKTAKNAVRLRLRVTGSSPSIRPLVPSTPSGGSVRSRAA
jgi:hypothetical protein